ncbi:hypothetical protein PoB_007557300 [Plakobranchus ocellatus]|uniref:Uncharacterized protein n=1 Tax=Plakobranchus ocellatus TaxID=259542 RepID=A0AAV4DXT0_9GAST|nr:hypothetical protein PoB_007557300 [Plakobranchus ocellatus]
MAPTVRSLRVASYDLAVVSCSAYGPEVAELYRSYVPPLWFDYRELSGGLSRSVQDSRLNAQSLPQILNIGRRMGQDSSRFLVFSSL